VRLRFADFRNPDSLSSRMRRARLAHFFEIVQSSPTRKPLRVLDVGGTEHFWSSTWNEDCEGLTVTLLNLGKEQIRSKLPIASVAGDARDLSEFRAGEFDFCFSNSVIEHVGTLADQKKMADEVRRVAKGYFVQTPNRFFPIEPHFHVPGWAQLPVWLRTGLHQRMDLGWMPAEPDYLKARAAVEGCRLISLREFRLLFPDGQIRLERVGPFLKSMIAVKAR
jgi:hypothetical protein